MIGVNDIVIIRRVTATATKDAWGKFVTATVDTSYPALVAWGSTGVENTLEFVRSTTSATVLFKGQDIPVNEDDIVIIGGDEFKIKGMVQKWKKPAGFITTGGTVLEVERREA